MSLATSIIAVLKKKLKTTQIEIASLQNELDEGLFTDCSEQILTKRYTELLIREQLLQKMLKRYTVYLGDTDCPYSLELDFKGCLKDDCQNEYELCWQKYFLEKAKENKHQWKPKLDETFWCVSMFGDVCCTKYKHYKDDEYMITHNLVFETKEDAEDYKWFLDKVDEYKKPFILGKNNRFIHYDHEDKKIYKDYSDYYQRQGTTYFGDSINIGKFIEEVGEDRIKKYWFNVEG